jgi:ATP-binding cassette subfamily B protein
MSKTKAKGSLKGSVSTFFKVLKYLKKYRFHFIVSLIFTAISVALTLYVPILV